MKQPTMLERLDVFGWQFALLAGRVRDLETRFASTELAKTAVALDHALKTITMDAEAAIRTILDAAKEKRV
jgi:hypothetical protein